MILHWAWNGGGDNGKNYCSYKENFFHPSGTSSGESFGGGYFGHRNNKYKVNIETAWWNRQATILHISCVVVIDARWTMGFIKII